MVKRINKYFGFIRFYSLKDCPAATKGALFLVLHS